MTRLTAILFLFWAYLAVPPYATAVCRHPSSSVLRILAGLTHPSSLNLGQSRNLQSLCRPVPFAGVFLATAISTSSRGLAGWA